MPLEESAEVLRFANRVPLQYQPKACAISEAVYELHWKNYGLSQPRGSLPVGPMAIFVHLASVWVPFTSEAKEAVAHYPELLREITLALQECGRKLAQSLRARAKAESDAKRKSLFERYIPELGQSLGKITGQNRDDIVSSFFKALPNFVKFVEVPEPDEPLPPNAAPAPAMTAPNGVSKDGAVHVDSGGATVAVKPEGPSKPARGAKAAAARAPAAGQQKLAFGAPHAPLKASGSKKPAAKSKKGTQPSVSK